MGLDMNRFVGEVEEDFLCVICKDVMEEPIASHCDHIFCKECINEWLLHRNTCPMDGNQLTLPQLRQCSRFFRKHYSMLSLKCDFESIGCQTVCKIKDLKTHQNECEFNANAKIICKKGCNALINKCEEQTHDCIQYIKSFYEKQIQDLKDIIEKKNKQMIVLERHVINRNNLERVGLNTNGDSMRTRTGIQLIPSIIIGNTASPQTSSGITSRADSRVRAETDAVIRDINDRRVIMRYNPISQNPVLSQRSIDLRLNIRPERTVESSNPIPNSSTQ